MFTTEVINKEQKFPLNFHGWICFILGQTDTAQTLITHSVRWWKSLDALLNFYTDTPTSHTTCDQSYKQTTVYDQNYNSYESEWARTDI